MNKVLESFIATLIITSVFGIALALVWITKGWAILAFIFAALWAWVHSDLKKFYERNPK